jgi:alpha-glucosidase (family GH31 glycosyl hydrolase)
MLGDRLLVAPVLMRGATSRAVLVPPGRWRSFDGSVVQGPRRIEVRAALGQLPYFERTAE